MVAVPTRIDHSVYHTAICSTPPSMPHSWLSVHYRRFRRVLSPTQQARRQLAAEKPNASSTESDPESGTDVKPKCDLVPYRHGCTRLLP